MIEGCSSPVQALLGSLFTWGLTAAGAALVFIFPSEQRKLLDGSLGFAAGVMMAASFWSLLDPAIEISRESSNGNFAALVPAVVGFFAGALFVYGVDLCLPELNTKAFQEALLVKEVPNEPVLDVSKEKDSYCDITQVPNGVNLRNRRPQDRSSSGLEDGLKKNELDDVEKRSKEKAWRRILMLVIAITVHNIPEGLAVGVGFGAVGKSETSTFENARNLALGIGIQNFPEGLAVSLPLRGCGLSPLKSFWWGQVSGLVEPIASLAGVLAIQVFQPLLPYALAFAAGAMIFVVVQELIPEAHSCGNGTLTSWSFVIGFLIMMTLDVGLA